VAEATEQQTQAVQQLAEAVNRILRGGLQVPGYSAAMVDRLKATGLIERPELLETYDPEDELDGVD